jgi:hypothetical protein
VAHDKVPERVAPDVVFLAARRIVEGSVFSGRLGAAVDGEKQRGSQEEN